MIEENPDLFGKGMMAWNRSQKSHGQEKYEGKWERKMTVLAPNVGKDAADDPILIFREFSMFNVGSEIVQPSQPAAFSAPPETWSYEINRPTLDHKQNRKTARNPTNRSHFHG